MVRSELLQKICNLHPNILRRDVEKILETIFHEFGHSLHGLLSDGKYQSTSGTNVFWDFVDLPSQIMENWVTQEETLKLFAKHYKTGKIIPKDLIDKIKKSQNFMSGTNCLRQLTFGYLDMAWFGKDNNVDNVDKFEEKAIKKTILRKPDTPKASISTQLCLLYTSDAADE